MHVGRRMALGLKEIEGMDWPGGEWQELARAWPMMAFSLLFGTNTSGQR